MRVVTSHIVPITLICLFCFAVRAEPIETLTWQDCVNEATQNNPDLVASQQDIQIKKEDKHLAQAGLLPQISATGQKNWSEGEGMVGGFAGTGGTGRSPNGYSFGITAGQLLFDGFKTVYDVQAAVKDVTAATWGDVVVSANVRLQLRSAFVELLKEQELVTLSKSIASRRRQNYQLIELRYQAGREHKGSLLTAQANLLQAEVSVTQAQRDLLLAQQLLLKTLGRIEKTPIRVKETMVSVMRNRMRPNFEQLADQNPFLKQVTAQKEMNQYVLNSAKSDLLPDISLNTSVSQTSSDWPPDQIQWSAGLNLTMPIFEGGKQIHQIQKNRAQYRQSLAKEQSVHNSLVYTLQESWTKWQDAIDSYSVQQKYLAAAVERSKIASAQYATGLVSFNEWTIIEDNLVNAQKAHLMAKTDVLSAEAAWRQAQGESLHVAEKQ
ncbi:MAG: outer membrane efflux protein [uncultured bacterium]|nr:MAG: outer membrane efflux protein [uncultured bacterium]